MEPTIQNSDIGFAENPSQHCYGVLRGNTVTAESRVIQNQYL
jgi:hypothetical protein